MLTTIENEQELKKELDRITAKVIEAYNWRKELPTVRIVDYSIIEDDFDNVVEDAFDNL